MKDRAKGFDLIGTTFGLGFESVSHLIPLSRRSNRNVGVWILLLMTFILELLTPVAPYRSTPLINQLQPSISPSTSHVLNSQGSQLHEAAVIKSSNPANYLASKSVEGVEMNITQSGEVFDGYNLVTLEYFYPSNRILNLILMNMEGEVIVEKPNVSYLPVKFINSTTVFFSRIVGGEHRVVLWNIYDNTEVELWSTTGHHELEYNALNSTFFTFERYFVKINGMNHRFDKIVEFNATGHLIWSVDVRSFISHTQKCPLLDWVADAVDITHSNSLFFDAAEDVLYYNARNVNTFYKIDHKTGQVLWGLGQYSDFTMFDRHGNPRPTLFYHAHTVKKVDDNTFILFDNDYHNQTNLMNQRSRILEITIDETTMTAHEFWTWIAPPDYFSSSWGDVDRLPNGNRLGSFGTSSHPNTNIGARLVEVNATGEIVWELNFPPGEEITYGVYRLKRFRFSPSLSSPPDIRTLSTDNVTVSWQTWYNTRINRPMQGSYAVYLDEIPIEHDTHVFDKFWRPTNITVNLGRLEVGDYNLTLALADEGGHITNDSVNISIVPSPFHITRDGSVAIELGQENALLQWEGDTSIPLLATLARNNTSVASFVWNGAPITLDLNSFEVGTHLVTLHLFKNTELVYEDEFLATIYPTAAPIIHSVPLDLSLPWNTSLVLSWELFDHAPASWSILVNATLAVSGPWETPSYQFHWNILVLDEGRYNITLVAYDHLGHRTARTTWLTVVPPSPPVIATSPHQSAIQWGQKHVSLSWEVHGGTHWTLWKNGTVVYSGEVTRPRIEVWIENWEQEDWSPGTYNLTLQVAEEDGTATTRTSWLQIWVNFGDVYADSVITEASMWYAAGSFALGPPDSKYAYLHFGYGNGHMTLDMGVGEEILDGMGADFTVYAQGGEYAVFVSNNLSAPVLVGNQVSAPLSLLGEGVGNTQFDLANSGLSQVRYIQIVYLGGEDVKIDAVEAHYFNQPPKPTSNFVLWRFPLLGVMLALTIIVAVIWVRRRK